MRATTLSTPRCFLRNFHYLLCADGWCEWWWESKYLNIMFAGDFYVALFSFFAALMFKIPNWCCTWVAVGILPTKERKVLSAGVGRRKTVRWNVRGTTQEMLWARRKINGWGASRKSMSWCGKKENFDPILVSFELFGSLLNVSSEMPSTIKLNLGINDNGAFCETSNCDRFFSSITKAPNTFY